jgi:hypothetical protein
LAKDEQGDAMSDDECEFSVQHEEPDECEDSVGEDAELELSCALQDLAQRVKTFEENMKGRFRAAGASDDCDDEIDEDIPEADAPVPKQPHRRRKDSAKKLASKQQADEEDEEDEDEDDPYGDDEFSDDDSDGEAGADAKGGRDDDWDYQEQTEELSELKHNIALLLQGFKEEAKALERGGDDDDDNQAK